MGYELTDGDLLDVFDTLECDCSEEDIARAAAKAQRKKLLRWLKAKCSEKSHVDGFGRKNIGVVRRENCFDCMQALLKEHEVE